MMNSNDIFLCHQCGKIFYKLSTLESHTKWKHMEKTNAFMCDQCGRTFQKKYNLIKHLESGIHYVLETVKCAVCDFRALNRKLMGEHYQTFHGIALKESNVYFKTADEFFSWKSDFENRTRSRFVKMSSTRKRKNGFMRSTYFCHRDGNFIPKGRNLRHLKVKGSNKINAHCPAKMDVDIGERIVIVTYIDTHLGHELDITRLSLDHADKALIAQKLALKVPFEKILDEINNKTQDGDLKRVNLLTRKDLWNIVDTFKLNPKNVVYSKARVRRKKKIDQPRKELRKNRVYLKVFNQDSNNSSDENQVLYNVSEEYSDNQVISVKQENEENVIFCPVLLKEENSDYIQEYTVISEDNEINAGTCLIINSNGELESISGHRVIYTEEGEVEICETPSGNDGELEMNDQSIGAQTSNYDLDEITVLDEGEETGTCGNVLMDEAGFSGGEEYQMENDHIFEVKQERNSSTPSVTELSDNSVLVIREQRVVGKSSIAKYSNQNSTEIVPVKQEVEDGSEIYVESKNSNETSDNSLLSPVKQMSMEENNPGYEVTIGNFDENINEYVVISTGSEEEECTAISNEHVKSEDCVDSVMSLGTVSVNEMKQEISDMEVINEEIIGSFSMDEEQCMNVGKPRWNEKRQEILHKLLNVHSMISNEQQLNVFSKNISSLENVLKALSKSEELLPQTSDPESQN